MRWGGVLSKGNQVFHYNSAEGVCAFQREVHLYECNGLCTLYYGYGPSALVARSAQTGEAQWQACGYGGFGRTKLLSDRVVMLDLSCGSHLCEDVIPGGGMAWVSGYTGSNEEIYGAITATLKALNITDGSLLWETVVHSGNTPFSTTNTSLEATDYGILVSDRDAGGWRVFDPASGNERGVIPYDVNDRASWTVDAIQGDRIYRNINFQLVATSLTTLGQVWMGNPLINAPSYVAVSDLYVVLGLNDTIDDVIYVHRAQDGAVERLVTLPANLALSKLSLKGSTLYFNGARAGNNGNDTGIYALNLSTGVLTFDVPIPYSSGWAPDFVSGDLAWRSTGVSAIDLTSAQTRYTTTLASLNCDATGQFYPGGLRIPTGDGFMCNRSAGGFFDGFQSVRGSVVSPTGTQAAATLREVILPVTLTAGGTISYAFTSPLLGSDPRTRGKLEVRAELVSAIPAGEPITRQHALAGSQTGLLMLDVGQPANVFQPERSLYRLVNLDIPESFADSAPIFNARILNSDGFTQTLDVTVLRPDGFGFEEQVAVMSMSNVGPGDSRVFTFTDTFPPYVGTTPYTMSINGNPIYASIEVTRARIEFLTVPAKGFDNWYYDDPDAVRVSFRNTSPVVAWLTDFHGVNGGLTVPLIRLDSGAAIEFSVPFTRTILNSASFSSTWRAGDVCEADLTYCYTDDRNVGYFVITEDSSLSAGLTGTVRNSSTLAGGGDLLLAYTSAPTQSFDLSIIGFEFRPNIAYSLQGPVTRSIVEQARILSGTQVFTQPLSGLPPGSYSARYTATSGATGRVLATTLKNFTIQAPAFGVLLEMAAGAPNAGGMALVVVTATAPISNESAWQGTLAWTGPLAETDAVALVAGQSAVFTRPVALGGLAGLQPITASLIAGSGGVALQRSLMLAGTPRPGSRPRLIGFSAGTGNIGDRVVLSVTLANPGGDGDAVVKLALFNEDADHLFALTANTTRTFSVSVAVPADLLDVVAVARASYLSATLSADVGLTGVSVVESASLDRADYGVFDSAVETVILSGTSGAPRPYDVILRYAGSDYTRTVMLGAGLTHVITRAFNVGVVSERATVLVNTHSALPTDPRRNLVIDTLYVNVRSEDGLSVTPDRQRYRAGETVSVRVAVSRPVRSLMVLAPEPFADVLWTTLAISPTPELIFNTVVTGSNGLSRTVTVTDTGAWTGTQIVTFSLPLLMPTGRYSFRILFDGEERVLPIDVFGVTLKLDDLDVALGAPALLRPETGTPIRMRAHVRSDTALSAVRLFAYAIGPDGNGLDLGALITAPLNLGANELSLTGSLNPRQPGAHTIVLTLRDPSDGQIVASVSEVIDVGMGFITDLQSAHGVYTPGSPGAATLNVYNRGVSLLRVATSSGAPLFTQTLTQTGFLSFTFAIPTAVEMDELLVGVMTDSIGMTSTAMTAYKVATGFDITPPSILILSPAPPSATEAAQIVIQTPGERDIIVHGTITNELPVLVLVNGLTATLDGANWSAPMHLEDGPNFVEVIAFDAAGNAGFTVQVVLVDLKRTSLLRLNASEAITLATGGRVTATAVITAADLSTTTVRLAFTAGGVIANLAQGPAVGPGNVISVWSGLLLPGLPQVITWSGTAATPVSGTAFLIVSIPELADAISNPVPYRFTGTAAQTRWVYVPTVRR